MAPYLSTFFLIALVAIATEITNRKWTLTFNSTFIFILIFIGLRDEVGGDWTSYLLIQNSISGLSLEKSLIYTDPAYGLISWLANYLNIGIYGVNFVCSAIFTYGLYRICIEQTKPWLGLCVAIPYIITAVAMGYTRQSAALGFVFLAISAIQHRKPVKFTLLIIGATLFHKSAIFCLIFTAGQFSLWDFAKKYSLLIIISFIFISHYIDHISTIYLSGQVESDGGMIRLIMNFIPACIFLISRKQWANKWSQSYDITFTLALLSFAFLPIGLFFSTFADRLALYLTPIQIAVYSRLPLLLPTSLRAGMMIAIILMYLTIFTVWLLWSPWAQCCWIPYKIYIP